MSHYRLPSRTVTGVALIVAPLVGVGLKMVSAGWTLMFLMFGPIIVLVAGYIVQVVIAAQGFLGKQDLFGDARDRATTAAWATSVSSVLVGVFFPDGTDGGYGSTFQKWLGSYGPNGDAVHAATDAWSEWLAIGLTAIWVVSYVWLFVEWVVASRRRKADARSTT